MKQWSSKIVKRRKKILIVKIVLAVVFLIAVIVGTSRWSNSESFHITNIKVEGNNFINKEKIISEAESLVEGKYFLGYSKSNSIIFPKSTILEKIKTENTSLKDLQIKREGLHTIKIKIEEYEPVALWCKNQENRECFFVNEEGLVFLKETLIHTYDLFDLHNVINEDNPVGQTYVSKEFLDSAILFNQLLGKLEMKIKKVETDDNHTFFIITDKGTKLIFDIKDDTVAIFDNLQTIIDQNTISKNQFSDVEYVDLRFGNKVFYKMKGEEVVE